MTNDIEPGEEVVEFYRSLTTDVLELMREAFRGDIQQAQRGPKHAKHGPDTIPFCEARLHLINQVLGARGVAR